MGISDSHIQRQPPPYTEHQWKNIQYLPAYTDYSPESTLESKSKSRVDLEVEDDYFIVDEVDWPRSCPVLHLNISNDFELNEHKSLLHSLYRFWIFQFWSSIVNFVAITATQLTAYITSGSQVVLAFITIIFVLFLTFFLYFRPLYWAIRTGSSVLYIWFYLVSVAMFALYAYIIVTAISLMSILSEPLAPGTMLPVKANPIFPMVMFTIDIVLYVVSILFSLHYFSAAFRFQFMKEDEFEVLLKKQKKKTWLKKIFNADSKASKNDDDASFSFPCIIHYKQIDGFGSVKTAKGKIPKTNKYGVLIIPGTLLVEPQEFFCTFKSDEPIFSYYFSIKVWLRNVPTLKKISQHNEELIVMEEILNENIPVVQADQFDFQPATCCRDEVTLRRISFDFRERAQRDICFKKISYGIKLSKKSIVFTESERMLKELRMNLLKQSKNREAHHLMTHEHWKDFLDAIYRLEYKAGEVIMEVGEELKSLYYISKGSVDVFLETSNITDTGDSIADDDILDEYDEFDDFNQLHKLRQPKNEDKRNKDETSLLTSTGASFDTSRTDNGDVRIDIKDTHQNADNLDVLSEGPDNDREKRIRSNEKKQEVIMKRLFPNVPLNDDRKNSEFKKDSEESKKLTTKMELEAAKNNENLTYVVKFRRKLKHRRINGCFFAFDIRLLRNADIYSNDLIRIAMIVTKIDTNSEAHVKHVRVGDEVSKIALFDVEKNIELLFKTTFNENVKNFKEVKIELLRRVNNVFKTFPLPIVIEFKRNNRQTWIDYKETTMRDVASLLPERNVDANQTEDQQVINVEMTATAAKPEIELDVGRNKQRILNKEQILSGDDRALLDTFYDGTLTDNQAMSDDLPNDDNKSHAESERTQALAFLSLPDNQRLIDLDIAEEVAFNSSGKANQVLTHKILSVSSNVAEDDGEKEEHLTSESISNTYKQFQSQQKRNLSSSKINAVVRRIKGKRQLSDQLDSEECIPLASNSSNARDIECTNKPMAHLEIEKHTHRSASRKRGLLQKTQAFLFGANVTRFPQVNETLNTRFNRLYENEDESSLSNYETESIYFFNKKKDHKDEKAASHSTKSIKQPKDHDETSEASLNFENMFESEPIFELVGTFAPNDIIGIVPWIINHKISVVKLIANQDTVLHCIDFPKLSLALKTRRASSSGISLALCFFKYLITVIGERVDRDENELILQLLGLCKRNGNNEFSSDNFESNTYGKSVERNKLRRLLDNKPIIIQTQTEYVRRVNQMNRVKRIFEKNNDMFLDQLVESVPNCGARVTGKRSMLERNNQFFNIPSKNTKVNLNLESAAKYDPDLIDFEPGQLYITTQYICFNSYLSLGSKITSALKFSNPRNVKRFYGKLHLNDIFDVQLNATYNVDESVIVLSTDICKFELRFVNIKVTQYVMDLIKTLSQVTSIEVAPHSYTFLGDFNYKYFYNYGRQYEKENKGSFRAAIDSCDPLNEMEVIFRQQLGLKIDFLQLLEAFESILTEKDKIRLFSGGQSVTLLKNQNVLTNYRRTVPSTQHDVQQKKSDKKAKFRDDDEPNGLYLLGSGSLVLQREVKGKRFQLYKYKKLDIINIEKFITNAPSPCTIKVFSTTATLKFAPREKCMKILRSDPALAAKFYQYCCIVLMKRLRGPLLTREKNEADLAREDYLKTTRRKKHGCVVF